MTIDAKPLRLFYALWPDAATCLRLLQAQERMHGRAVHRDDFHLTLAFLGEQPPDLLPLLKQILVNLPQSGMALTLDQFGYFRRNRIATLEMSAAPAALFDLQAVLAAELARCQVRFDQSHRFRPHITLARNAGAPGDAMLALPILWQVGHIALAQSIPDAAGAKYRLLARR